MDGIYDLDETGRFIPSRFTLGPWDPTLQHGAPPSTLMARAAERAIAGDDYVVTRLTVDLMRPLPLSPMDVRVETVRAGRMIRVLQISIWQDGKESARASALAMRRADFDTGAAGVPPALDGPGPHDGGGDVSSGFTGFNECVVFRMVDGGMGRLGPGKIWYRITRPLVTGEPISPLMRAIATADFANGVSSELDFDKWTYINADLTLDIVRPPQGEWILLDAFTWLGVPGIGLAEARLADETGYFATARQHLVIGKR